jgi:hypothetical protein
VETYRSPPLSIPRDTLSDHGPTGPWMLMSCSWTAPAQAFEPFDTLVLRALLDVRALACAQLRWTPPLRIRVRERAHARQRCGSTPAWVLLRLARWPVSKNRRLGGLAGRPSRVPSRSSSHPICRCGARFVAKRSVRLRRYDSIQLA